jgi:hypothetical protein
MIQNNFSPPSSHAASKPSPAAKLRRKLREATARKRTYAARPTPEHKNAICSQLPLIAEQEVIANLRVCELYLKSLRRRVLDRAWSLAESSSDGTPGFEGYLRQRAKWIGQDARILTQRELSHIRQEAELALSAHPCSGINFTITRSPRVNTLNPRSVSRCKRQGITSCTYTLLPYDFPDKQIVDRKTHNDDELRKAVRIAMGTTNRVLSNRGQL